MSQPVPGFHSPHPAPLQEAAADLDDAHGSMQALLGLLCGCDPAQPLAAGNLRSLLLPIAGAVGNAHAALALATR